MANAPKTIKPGTEKPKPAARAAGPELPSPALSAASTEVAATVAAEADKVAEVVSQGVAAVLAAPRTELPAPPAATADISPGSLPAAAPAAGSATKTIATSAAETRTAMEKSMDQITRGTEGFYKATEEAVEFGRGNLEALTKATQTYITGLQDLSKQAFAVMQGLNEQAVANAKALSSVKSLKEAAEIQAGFAKAQLEKSMAEATRLNEAAFKLAEQSSAPIAARMTLAVEKFSRPTNLV
ncbi:phasin family protein [Roseomonas sp. USHLN139]|uniref:phasin family protein n=1 Tax=Roseomonas sp. USHLN139 TaxID=3081298 RepID=UPI003B026044